MIEVLYAYAHSIRLILGDRKLLMLCFLPWVIGGLIFALCYLGVWYFASDTFKGALSLLGSESIASIFSAILVFVVSSVLALFLTLIANEFTTDAFAARFYEQILGGTPPARSTARQLSEGLFRLAVLTTIAITTFIIGLIPLLQLVALVLSAFSAGYLLTDFMLCVSGQRLAERVRSILSSPIKTLILGAVFLPTFAIPFLSILLLPVGYGAALIVMSERAR